MAQVEHDRMRRPRGPGRRGPWDSEEGIALIVALIVTIILVAITLQFSYTTTIDLKLVRNQSRDIRSFFAARGGITLAKAHLQDDLLDEGESGSDSYHDEWAGAAPLPDETESSLEQEDLLGYEGGSFHQNIGETALEYRIRDEDGKICINNLALEELKLQSGGESEEAPEGDEGPGGELKPGEKDPGKEKPDDKNPPDNSGKKGELDPKKMAEERVEFTKKLLQSVLMQLGLDDAQAEGIVYAMEEDAPFHSVRELARYDGLTPEILNGYTDDYGYEVKGLVDLLTVYSRGTVNVNTAAREVLVAMLTEKYESDAESFADAILEYRAPNLEILEEEAAEKEEEEKNPPPPTSDDDEELEEEEEEEEEEPAGGVFNTLDDLAKEIPGLEAIFGGGEQDEPSLKAGRALKRHLGVKSRFFQVVVIAGDDPYRMEYRFVLRRGSSGGESMPVLIWEERPLPIEDEDLLEEYP